LYSTAASTLRKNQNQLQKLPPNNQLWGFVINAGAVGLIYLLLGVWTRSSQDETLRIWDLQTGQEIRTLRRLSVQEGTYWEWRLLTLLL